MSPNPFPHTKHPNICFFQTLLFSISALEVESLHYKQIHVTQIHIIIPETILFVQCSTHLHFLFSSFPPPLFDDRLLLACCERNEWLAADRQVCQETKTRRERMSEGEFYLGNINIHPLISSQQNLPHPGSDPGVLKSQSLSKTHFPSLFDLSQQLSNIFVKL